MIHHSAAMVGNHNRIRTRSDRLLRRCRRHNTLYDKRQIGCRGNLSQLLLRFQQHRRIRQTCMGQTCAINIHGKGKRMHRLDLFQPFLHHIDRPRLQSRNPPAAILPNCLQRLIKIFRLRAAAAKRQNPCRLCAEHHRIAIQPVSHIFCIGIRNQADGRNENRRSKGFPKE